MAKRIIIVGLGNPGPSYARHRHNVGFMVVDRLAKESGADWKRDREKALICQAEVESRSVVLVKPLTYMNLSGKAVAPIVSRLNTTLAEMIVIHDDLDLPEGTVRIKVGGGDGGHRGIRSIADSLRFREFVRVRLGIGRPPTGIAAEEFVLTPFPSDAKGVLLGLMEGGCEAVRLILCEGVERAQNTIHSKRA